MIPKITAERLRQLVKYDKTTGLMVWAADKMSRHGTVERYSRIGLEVGSYKNGYLYASIDGVRAFVHRFAWLYETGKWPHGLVDHKNGNGLDNRWSNIRDATFEINAENIRAARSHSKTGLLGVRVDRARFQAVIQSKGVKRHLGCFATAEEAHLAYLDAKRKLHKGCTI